MTEIITKLLIIVASFLVITIASNQVAKQLVKYRFPIITGLLLMGVLCGPYGLNIITLQYSQKLLFVNDLSLAFIAFAASAELYLRELRSRINSISWNTMGQLVVTFGLGSIAVYFASDFIPFMKEMEPISKLAVSILFGTIFVARSPASAIAVINEMRAKGPFTQTAIGVTVLKDFIVIVLFAVNFAIAGALINKQAMGLGFIFYLILELVGSFALGFVVGKVLEFILHFRIRHHIKSVLIIVVGFSVYELSHFIASYSEASLGHVFHLEPLLICIVGSFLVTNYTKYRPEFIKILEETGPFIYMAFFTLTGATMALDVLIQVWPIALLFFMIRLLSMMIGAYTGATLAKDPKEFRVYGWMPYVTQAGVALGLSTIIANAFPGWGNEFSTIVIAVIVLNQIIGPPLFKYAIQKVGESHEKAEDHVFDGQRDCIIFGLENHSIALAKQLEQSNWNVIIATTKEDVSELEIEDLNVQKIKGFERDTFEQLDAWKAEAVVLLLSDTENLAIGEFLYEHVGVKDVVVRITERWFAQKFHQLGFLVVDPSTAMVSLMDHLVRSPMATSLLLGMQEGQDSLDLELLNTDLHGITLRELRLPSDLIILSVKRGGQMIITHGYTRLRKGDIITLVGSKKSLQNTSLKFEGV